MFACISLLVTTFQLDISWYRTYITHEVFYQWLWLSTTYVDVVIMVRSILILVSYARFLGEVSGYYTNYANAAFVKRIMRTGFIWGRFSCRRRRGVALVVSSPGTLEYFYKSLGSREMLGGEKKVRHN